MIQGAVIPKDSINYASARDAMVWNRRVTQARSPDAIVQVASAKDVVTAIRFARANGFKVAIRGGGHNYQGSPLRDGALLLDLSRLTAVEVNASQRRASVQPAVTGGQLAAALSTRGLAFPVGQCRWEVNPFRTD